MRGHIYSHKKSNSSVKVFPLIVSDSELLKWGMKGKPVIDEDSIIDADSTQENQNESFAENTCEDPSSDSLGSDSEQFNPARGNNPMMPFEGEFSNDIDLMKEMGLPLGFLTSPRDLEEVKKIHIQ